MAAADVGSQKQLHQRLLKQVSDLNAQGAQFTSQLNAARELYSRLHGQYQMLQDDVGLAIAPMRVP